MASFTTEAKVGVFVLIGLALLAYMSFKVGGFDLAKGKGYELEAVFDNASGLKTDGPVQIAGIDVGTIKNISLEGNRAKITILLTANVNLPVDSRALIRTQGILGDKYLEIVPGTTGAPILATGDMIVKTATPTDMDQILNKIGELSDDIQKVSGSLGDALGGEEGAAQLKQILKNFAVMSENLARLTEDNNEQLNKMIENLTLFSADLREMSSANKENINAILATFRQTSENMSRTIAALQDISERVNRGEGTIGALVNDDTTVESLNETLASLRDISDKINSGQGTIGKLVNDTKTGEKLDEALTGINDYLAKDKAFKAYIDYRGDYLFRHERFKHTFNVRLQPNDDKFYLLGVVSDPSGKYEREDRILTVNGRTTTITDEKWTRGELKFNAQFGKRYHDMVIRGGLIESGGGVGFDYYMLDDDLKLTFEAYTGDFNHNAHLRAGATYDFWKIFYVSAGYDDIISDQDRNSAYVGFGIRFNDDDIKSILGSLPISSGD